VFDHVAFGEGSSIVAELELPFGAAAGTRIALDPSLTMLSNASGDAQRDRHEGALELRGARIPSESKKDRTRQ
jgi:hypothetical protein